MLAVDGAAIHNACEAAREFAAAAALSDETCARLCIIIEELVANLVDYAGLTTADRVSLNLETRNDDIVVVLTDPGPPFDPRVAAPPGDLPPERGGGAGLAMVQAFAHVESYIRIGDINRLTLRMAANIDAA